MAFFCFRGGCFFFLSSFLLFFSVHPLFVKRKAANITTIYNSSSSTIPPIIFQVGTPRTATTTQYALLLAIAELRNPHHVATGFIGGGSLSDNRLKSVRNGFTLVAKLHQCGPVSTLDREEYPYIMFTTDPQPGKWCRPKAQLPAIIQDPRIYFRKGFPYLVELIHTQYKPLFNLNDTEVGLLVEFMEKYEPVRRCCGNQMSASFSKYLRMVGMNEGSHFFDFLVQKTTDDDNSTMTNNNQTTTTESSSSLPHYCANKNLTKLAYEYSETTMVKNFPGPLRNDYHAQCMEGMIMFRMGVNHHKHGPVKNAVQKIVHREQFREKTNGFRWFDDEEVWEMLKELYLAGKFNWLIEKTNDQD